MRITRGGNLNMILYRGLLFQTMGTNFGQVLPFLEQLCFNNHRNQVRSLRSRA